MSAIKFTYTNWRGEIAVRHVIPIDIYYGSTDWHPEQGWLMRGIDMDKNGAERDFALKDCNFTVGAGK